MRQAGKSAHPAVELALFLRAQAGLADARKELLDLVGGRIRSVSLRCFRDRPREREECANYVADEFVMRLGRFDPDGEVPLNGWIATTIARLAIDYGREILGWARRAATPAGDPPPETERLEVEPESQDPPPFEPLVQQEELDDMRILLRAALRESSPWERLVFKLKYPCLGLSLDEPERAELHAHAGPSCEAALHGPGAIAICAAGTRRTKDLAKLLSTTGWGIDAAVYRVRKALAKGAPRVDPD